MKITCSAVLLTGSSQRASNGFSLGFSPFSSTLSSPKSATFSPVDKSTLTATDAAGGKETAGGTLGLAPVSEGDKRGLDDPGDAAAEVLADAVADILDVVDVDGVGTDVVDDADEAAATSVGEVLDSSVAVAAAVLAPEVVPGGALAPLDAVAEALALATTALYCCISITAASSSTWMFLRHLILASTLLLSLPSISSSSVSDMPEKLGGGWGGGTVKGRKGNGGNMKGGLTPPAAGAVPVPGAVAPGTAAPTPGAPTPAAAACGC